MRHVLRALLAGGLGLAVAFLAACGGGVGLLSSGQAGSLNDQLSQISQAVSSGQCSQASAGLTGFSNAVENLSGQGVNSRLVANLQQASSALSRVATKDCAQSTTTSSATTTSAPTSTSTSTSPSTPTTTSTTTTSAPTTTSSATSNTGTGTSSGGGSGGAGLGGAGAPSAAGGGTGGGAVGG